MGVSAGSGLLRHLKEMGIPQVSFSRLRIDALTTALRFHLQTSQLEDEEGAMLLSH